MTVIISFHQPNMIIMSADSKETSTFNPDTSINDTFQPITDYHERMKIFPVENVGCVSMWGDFTRIKKELDFATYLRENLNRIENVDELKIFVDKYLREDLRPHEGYGDVGFHIGGFMPSGESRLYHIFYGPNRKKEPLLTPEDRIPQYRGHPLPIHQVLYNGRNELVEPLLEFLNQLQQHTQISIFENDPIKHMALANFLTRYISQFIEDVGGDIYTFWIKPDNKPIGVTTIGNAVFPTNDLRKYLDDLKDKM